MRAILPRFSIVCSEQFYLSLGFLKSLNKKLLLSLVYLERGEQNTWNTFWFYRLAPKIALRACPIF